MDSQSWFRTGLRVILTLCGLASYCANWGTSSLTLEDIPCEYQRLWSWSGFDHLVLSGLFLVMTVTVLWCVIMRVLRRGARLSVRSARSVCSWLFVPLSLGLVMLLQFSPFLTGISRVVQVMGNELSMTMFLFSVLAVLVNIGLITGLIAGKRLELYLQTVNTWLFSSGPIKSGLVIFVISFGIYYYCSGYLPGLNGDEPHYLLITQSLLQDGDLDVHNNYCERDYNEYMPGVLDRHVSIGQGGVRYSTHPVGLAFLIAPAYYLLGYRGVVLFMNMCAALLAVQLFLLSRSVLKGSSWAYYIWVLVCFAPPLLPYSAKVFPELPAALLCAYVYRVIVTGKPLTSGSSVFVMISLAALPWLQQRFIILALLLALDLVVRNWSNIKAWTVIVGGYCLSMVGLMLFYQVLYGNPLPSAPYTSIGMDTIWSWDTFIGHGMWGLLFDQEYGILVYAPVFLLALGGLYLKFRRSCPDAFFWMAMFLSVYIPAGGFTLKWFGSWAPMGRYMVVLIPLLVELIALILTRPKRQTVLWTYALIFWITLMFSYHLLVGYDLWIGSESGRSKLLSSLTESTQTTQWFPTLISPIRHDYFVVGIWLVSVVFLNWLMVRSKENASFSGCRDRIQTYLSEEVVAMSVAQVSRSFLSWAGMSLFGLILLTGLINADLGTCLSGGDVSFGPGPIIELKQTCCEGPKSYEEYRYPVNRNSRAGSGPPDYIVSGPYISLEPGLYEVLFTVELTGPGWAENILSFDVCTYRGHHVLTSGRIGSADFGADDRCGSFSLYFSLDRMTPNIETRVFSYRTVDLLVSEIVIRTSGQLKSLWQGRVLAEKGYRQQALARYLQIEPDDGMLVVVYKERAQLYQVMGMISEALEDYGQYYAHHPEDQTATRAYGALLLKTERREEGIRVLRRLEGL
ncbi:hypothetical protein JXQ70_10520 [bacterium]|nr:hypothetical protein [bacterium]